MSDNQTEVAVSAPPSKPIRLPTGIKGLDIVLQGGFMKGDSYIIMGAPGMGKTIMANQIAFNHIAAGGKVVFLTVMTETHNRMISHLRALSFFNMDVVSSAMYYVSGYSTLENDGLDGLLTLCRNIIKERRATLLILDGLATAEDLAPSGVDFKRFIRGLDAYSEVHGCTTLLLTHRGGGNYLQTEYTMVDGIIELTDELVELRNQRKLHVLKFRGSAFLQGRHSLEITSNGIVIHPRSEVQYTNSHIPAVSPERLQFGITRLDEMLGGGLPASTCTTLYGPTGSGKTSLGLQFLANGLAAGQSCLLFNFYESPARLIDKAAQIGINLAEYQESGLLQIQWQPPLEFDLDWLADRLLNIVQQYKVKRLFIDGLDAFYQAAIYTDRLSRYWAAITNELRSLNITTVFSFELPGVFGGNIELPIHGISAITENVILLRLSELRSELKYLISVMKERDSDHDRRVHEFFITSQGIRVGDVFGAGEGLLNSLSGGVLSNEASAVKEAASKPPDSETEAETKETKTGQ